MQQEEEEDVEEVKAKVLIAKFKKESGNVAACLRTLKVDIEGHIVSRVRRRRWMTPLCKKK